MEEVVVFCGFVANRSLARFFECAVRVLGVEMVSFYVLDGWIESGAALN
jgi:hypothetical protein